MVIGLISCMFKLQELLQLEEDVKLLEEVYPQGEKVIISDSLTNFEVELCFVSHTILPLVFSVISRLRHPGL